MVAIVGVAAFQNLAMTTIMPVISRDLDGETLYSLAFAAPLAAGVPGMVLAGNWTDRAGGRVVAWVSAAFFAVATAVVMLAPTMEVFLAGRLVEGFGAGAIDVVLYVLVARIFPADAARPGVRRVRRGLGRARARRPRPRRHRHRHRGAGTGSSPGRWRSRWLRLRPARADPRPGPRPGRVAPPAVAARPDRLVGGRCRVAPAAQRRARPAPWGLSRRCSSGRSRHLVRPAAAAAAGRSGPRPGCRRSCCCAGSWPRAFFGSEAYVPFLLQAEHGLSPSAAGLALTVAALSWAASSWAHGRLGEQRLPAPRTFGVGLDAGARQPGRRARGRDVDLSWWVLVAGWFVGGAAWARVPARLDADPAVLRRGRRRFASSALTIADAAGSVVGLAVTGLLFTRAGGADGPLSFPLVFAAMIGFAALAVAVRPTARPRAAAGATAPVGPGGSVPSRTPSSHGPAAG